LAKNHDFFIPPALFDTPLGGSLSEYCCTGTVWYRKTRMASLTSGEKVQRYI